MFLMFYKRLVVTVLHEEAALASDAHEADRVDGCVYMYVHVCTCTWLWI